MARERLSLPIELQGVDVQRGTFTGLCSVFGSLCGPQPPANMPTMFLNGAWSKTLKEQAGKVTIYGGEAIGKSGHDILIGHMIAGVETNAGLQITGHISDTQVGRDTLSLMRDGALKELSVGWVPIIAEKASGREIIERMGRASLPHETAARMREHITEYGENATYRLVREARLFHVAVVSEGLDPATSVIQVNEKKQERGWEMYELFRQKTMRERLGSAEHQFAETMLLLFSQDIEADREE